MARAFRSLVLGVVAMLGGCVAYEPAPLDRRPLLAARLDALDIDSRRPLTVGALDRLVLRRNPDLVAARTRLGLGEAQILQAGLLPNPQFTANYPIYIAGPDGSSGFGLGLAQDLRSLLLRPTRREVAASAAAEIRASILWQEWQIVGKARLLLVDLVSGERAARAIARSSKYLKERFDLTSRSIDQGNAPLANLSPDLVAVGDVQKLADDLARLQMSRRHQLAALLGLAPDAPLRLPDEIAVPHLDPALVRRDAAALAERRPDLVALQYGYRSEDAKLRQAILTQYPNVLVSVGGGRDTNAIYSVTPQATIDLPIFDRGEGTIALEAATRAQLQAEFTARITQASGEIGALLSEQVLASRQLAALEPRLKQSRDIAGKSEAAYREGNFDERAYVDVEVAVLTLDQQKIALQQALLEGQAALATLTGAGLPPISIGPEPAPANPLGLLRTVAR